MKIGYACMTIGLDTSLKSCILKNATPDVLSDIIANNLTHLKNSILYNIENNIKLFRISSDIIPFASHPVNTLNWKTIYKDELFSIGTLIKKSNMRVSMHPGQYTIINSPTAEVVEKSILELQYHADFLVMYHSCCWNKSTIQPNSKIFITNPITISCISCDLEKQIDLRVSLLILVLRVRFFLSIV